MKITVNGSNLFFTQSGNAAQYGKNDREPTKALTSLGQMWLMLYLLWVYFFPLQSVR